MNAKKKNKKANKPPNPNPPQKVENVPKSDENSEKLTSEVKEEQILKPEIVSEVTEILQTVSEVKEIGSSVPKKPNRNKGKKKHQDLDEEIIKSIHEVPQKIENAQNLEVLKSARFADADQKGETDEKLVLDDTNVTPSARKKKNKKKPQDKLLQETQTSETVSTPISVEEVTEATEKVTDIQDLISSHPETAKLDTKKKKNKKKNRNDSEKSDKSDSTISCTSAFQKLMKEDDISQVEPLKSTTDGSRKEIHISLPLEKDKEKINIAEFSPSEELKEVKIVQPQDGKELSKDKSKKKNKKDKNQVQQEISQETKTETEQKSVQLDDLLTQKVLPEKSPKNVIESLEIEVKSQKGKEPSPKPKAKIAKPVEKKRKEKEETHNSENFPGTVGYEIPKEEDVSVPITEIKKGAQEQGKTTTMPLEIMESMSTDEILPEGSESLNAPEKINVPIDGTMGKKRKKSPRPPMTKHTEENVRQDVIVLPLKKTLELPKEETKTLTNIVPDLLQSNIDKEPHEKPMTISDTKNEDVLKPQPDQKINISDTTLHEPSLTLDLQKDDIGFETKTSKKKKKTPKVPQTITKSFETKILEASNSEKLNKNQETFKVEESIDFPQELSFSSDLEIQSVKTGESEASSCDAVPDVFFVRSSSQQFLDDNNNTIIQEVMHIDEIKTGDSLSIPSIEGSGETPTITPEIVTSGIVITEIEVRTPAEEKTDIKSKIMEVNQDMEELRLSIERSLAEFTALEKSEHELEIKDEAKSISRTEKSPVKEFKCSNVDKPIKTSEIKDDIPSTENKYPEKPSPSKMEEVFMPDFNDTPPVCPSRKDNKGKSKSKKKGKQDTTQAVSTPLSESTATQAKSDGKAEKQEKTEQNSGQKSDTSQEKAKQKSATVDDDENSNMSKDIDNIYEPSQNLETNPDATDQNEFNPIEKFEDALTSSVDDVNITFEMIAKEVDDDIIEIQKKLAANKPEINITEAAKEDTNKNRNEKVNPVSQPKNLLGQTDIPVRSNRTDYKKEKNKTPNARQAKVKIKDSIDVEKKQTKESQTDVKRDGKNGGDTSVKESFSRVRNDNEEYVYKYSFRKVFLQSACLVCNKDLSKVRVPCGYCNLVFYCGAKHKDEDWPQHQALCFAVSTLAHMKDQKHIYADAQNATGQDYRLLRMQMIVSCEKVLKRRLVPWEQEAMLYPRICADVACREWRQGKLKDCDGCGQLSYCATNPSHLPKSHTRWCKSYSLYQKLVSYQQTKGRLEPKLPTKVLSSEMPSKMNEVLASLYEEKIDMNDIQYAALTQLATAPLTAAYCLQLCRKPTGSTNGILKKQPFTVHVVGAELQFEADALNKWETFFLHLRPDVEELKVVLVSPMLNPGNLPLELLGRIKLCDNCLDNKRRVVFKFEDNKNYFEYRTSENFINPDIICAFNPSIQRSSIYNGKDPWPATINSILKLKQPFIVTSYTLNELRKDIARIQQVADINFKLVSEPGFNNFASVRPDRNFISDDEMPLLFKNYCAAVVLGC